MKKILIVEDNDMNRKLNRDLLLYCGFEVVDAAIGCQAISLALSQKPDLILLDINLPLINGLEVAKILKAKIQTASIPIILISALMPPNIDQLFKTLNCDSYISKPFKIQEFLKIIKDTLRSNAKQPENLNEHFQIA